MQPSVYSGVPQSFTASITFTLDGAAVSDMQQAGQQTNLISVIAEALQLPPKDVVIISVSSSTMMRTALARVLGMGVGSSSIKISILGFTSYSSASATLALVTTYLGGSFASDFHLASGLVVISVSVTFSDVNTVTTGSLAHQCKLNNHLSLYWTTTSGMTGGAGITGMLTMDSASNWFSGGNVALGETSMVSSTSTNKVYLYSPSAVNPKLGCYSMNAKSASGFTMDPAMRAGTGITSVQSLPTSSSMSFTIAADTGVSSDVQINLGAGKYNTYIWAHGGDWPAQHDKGNYGFVNVYWTDGHCEEVGMPKGVSPAFVYLFLLLVAVFHSPYSPLTSLLAPLHTTKIPLPFLHEYSVSGLFFVLLYFGFNLLVLFTNSSSSVISIGTLASASGKVTILNFWMALIPTSKTSATVVLFGVPFERATKYHKVCTIVGMVLGLVHIAANLAVNASVFYSAVPYGSQSVRPLFGLLAYFAFSAMTLMAFPAIRNFSYELFRVFHYLYWLGVALVIVHTAGGYLGFGFLPGLLLQAWDKLRRIYLTFHPEVSVAVARTDQNACQVVKLTLPRKIKYEHGQYYYLQIQVLSAWEWHPFSVSGGDNNVMTFHIKSNGPDSWTGRLGSPYINIDTVAVDGPYGSISLDLSHKSYRKILFICGGIGITPFLPIIADLVANQERYSHIAQMHLVWSARGAEIIELFRPQLQALIETGGVVVDIYHTSNGGGGGGKVGGGIGGMNSSSKRGGIDFDYDFVGTNEAIEMGIISTQQPAKAPARPVQISCHTGRPGIEALLHDLKADELARRVNEPSALNAVLVCGPQALADTVQKGAAWQRLSCHKEVFSL